MSLLTFLGRTALAGVVLMAARPAGALPALGLSVDNTVVTFDTATPATAISGPTAVTGVVAGETLIGIDLRPATGRVYAIGKAADGSGHVYTLNPTTGVVTLGAALVADPSDLTAPFTGLSGAEFGTDFNPVPDRLRVVSDTNQNLRINVTNGLVVTDGDLQYAVGDPRAGQTPLITASAYTNSYPGATTTTLYDIDFTNTSPYLIIQNPPNNGTLNSVGPTNIAGAGKVSGFDISPDNTTAFCTLTSSGVVGAYLSSVNLTNGQGNVVFINGRSPMRGFTLLSPVATPVTTNATTNEDTQSNSGLVILPGSGGATPTTHFKVTGITNGKLYQFDGTTEITEGSFITTNQGAAGLKFTPKANFSGNATFTVRAAASNTDAGVGGEPVEVIIQVNPVNDAPTIDSVNPQGATDKVGDSRNFSISVSDFDGTRDIEEIWLLINDRLGWGSGATLIYRPDPVNALTGTLTLRRGDAFLPPIVIGEGSNPNAVLDNGALRIKSSDVYFDISGDFAENLILTIPATVRDGLVGTNTLFAYAVDRDDVVAPGGLPGDNGFVRFGPYTVKPQFSGDVNVPPTLGKLTPGATYTTLNGSGIAPAAQTIGFFASDADGVGDLDTLIFIADKSIDFTQNATFLYEVRTRRLSLRSDDGNSWLGGVQVGQPTTSGILENSQVRVDLSKVKVSILGDGKSVGLSLPLQAKTGLIGANKIWLRVQDKAGATSISDNAQSYILKGTWNVKASNVASPPTGAPSNGSS